jgi:hypothetical protein
MVQVLGLSHRNMSWAHLVVSVHAVLVHSVLSWIYYYALVVRIGKLGLGTVVNLLWTMIHIGSHLMMLRSSVGISVVVCLWLVRVRVMVGGVIASDCHHVGLLVLYIDLLVR